MRLERFARGRTRGVSSTGARPRSSVPGGGAEDFRSWHSVRLAPPPRAHTSGKRARAEDFREAPQTPAAGPGCASVGAGAIGWAAPRGLEAMCEARGVDAQHFRGMDEVLSASERTHGERCAARARGTASSARARRSRGRQGLVSSKSGKMKNPLLAKRVLVRACSRGAFALFWSARPFAGWISDLSPFLVGGAVLRVGTLLAT